MPATTDNSNQTAGSKPVLHLWRAGGVAFLLVSLAALSAGAFCEFFLAPQRMENLLTPPALQMLLAAQAVFLVMFYPLIYSRRRNGGAGAMLVRGGIEQIIFLAVSIPLYVVAAVLSDATATDVIRGLLYLAGLAVLTLGLGLWAGTGRAAIVTAVALAGALIAVGAPVVSYLLMELTDAAGTVKWLWSAAPATCAFDTAAARGANWHPTPIWAWALWPVTGVVLTFAFLLADSKRVHELHEF